MLGQIYLFLFLFIVGKVLDQADVLELNARLLSMMEDMTSFPSELSVEVNLREKEKRNLAKYKTSHQRQEVSSKPLQNGMLKRKWKRKRKRKEK